jgi:cell division GTPase FtsZ
LKVFLIGLGRAGCRIAYQFFTHDLENVYGVLIDTDLADLGYLRYRYRIPAGEGILSGEGTGRDIDLGMQVIQAEKFSIVEKISRLKEGIDCFFVISALGGGTGGACGPLLEELKKNFIEPVYYIGLLPSREDLQVTSINAAKGLREAIRYPDAFFPIDMDNLKSSTSLKGNFKSLNSKIFRYFQPLFQIGEFKGRDDIGENAVDFSDLAKTLKGLSVAGHAWLNLEEDPNADKPEAVIALTKKASQETTLSIDNADVQKALVVVLGDRKYIDFLGSIPSRLWVEKNISGKEVRGGDLPLSKKGQAEVLLVFSDIKRSNKIASLYQKVELLSRSQSRDENLSEVVERIGMIKGKIFELEEEINKTYQMLKKSVEEKK